MILKSISPKNFGPFVSGTTLELDPEVTVITGSNDVGKSLALRAVEILCTKLIISSHEVNRHRTGEFKGSWNEDPEVICTGVFEATKTIRTGKRILKPNNPGAVVTVTRRMNEAEGLITEVTDKDVRTNPRSPFSTLPLVLKLPLATEVRQEINLADMTEAERYLVRLGFGPEFSFEQHKGLSQVDRAFRIREGETNLNLRLRDILPATMPLQFMLLEIAGKPELLGVGILDEHKGFAPLGSRGSGVRRLLNVMGAILRLNPDDGHAIVLYDEPETSLHADAQHMLRRLFETLGAHPNVQVVYTTHSPAMINAFRPQSIRLVERGNFGGKPCSVFRNEAFGKNYSQVRMSLGISPADSLLYAPITIIGEGKSEVLGIPAILEKLSDAGILDAQKLSDLLPQVHLLDGEGSNFETIYDMAASQRAIPVVFVDGDKNADIRRFLKSHSEVPVIQLDEGKEIEDLVPRSAYFAAICALTDHTDDKLNEEAFDRWVERKDLKSSMMFSKRVDWWLYEMNVVPPKKHMLFLKAVQMADASQIAAGPFIELVDAMNRVSATI